MRVAEINGKNISRWYKRFSILPGSYGYYGAAGKAFFYRSCLGSLHILEFPFGIVRLTDHVPGIRIIIHALFDRAEALKAIEAYLEGAKWIFDNLDVARIEANVPAEKKSLGRLLERAKFKREGLLRKAYFDGTIYKDKVLYSLIREDIGYGKYR